MFGLSVETMFALTLIFQGLILAFLFLNIRVFGVALDILDRVDETIKSMDAMAAGIEEAFLEQVREMEEREEEIQKNLEDWT
jgi:uncharacterized membrane protein|tara:strand:+ start:1305 stop:1550 length:246 start_codon:yes stop_codon:yes gene_type:complete